ncbi:MAG: hypothetical protein K2X64_02895 [Rhodocyclaceae bacterium]|jgi:hypothetical protein|nr:hypothetical protein [Rhodocyclaceae bacterium]
MKTSLVLTSIATLILTIGSDVVISKSFPSKDEIFSHTQPKESAVHLVEADILGDIGDEFMTDCNAKTGKHPTCQELWAGLGKIVVDSPNGVY